MIDSFLRERKADLAFILYSYRFEDLIDIQKLRKCFGFLQKQSNTFVDLGVFNEKGLHVSYQGPYKLEGRDYSKEAWFAQVNRQGHYISDVYLGYRRVPHFVIALRREDAGQTWVLRATIDTYMFNNLVKRVRIGTTGEAYILNGQGVFQTERRSGGNIMDSDPDTMDYFTQHEDIKTCIITDVKGVAYLSATAWLKEKKWLLVIRQEKADAFQELRSAAYLIVLVVVIGGSAIVFLAFYLTHRIVRRMEQMDAEKDRLGEQLIRASGLAELGEMAAGFAHEINNPLQIIKSEQALMESIIEDLKKRWDLKESAELANLEDSVVQVGVQIGRCAKITQAILKFGRQTETAAVDIELQRFVPEILEIVANQAAVHGIKLVQDIPEGITSVHGDPGQLQQVLLNLFNNAIDAIKSKHGSKGGKLFITARQKEDGKVEIAVKDNGCGISPENQKKVFNPFFTTKPAGEGTGLGLSICHGIIENMEGTMSISSIEGVGTTFTISLPASV
jgi:two-component system NtrC family sensor kinase